jgi:hypothetical protein
MNKIQEKFGKLTAASFIIMAAGVVLFLLTIPLYAWFNIDTDIIGVIVFSTGLAFCFIGIIRKKKLHGWKFAGLAILAAVFSLPLLSLLVSMVYELITGEPPGG